MKTYITKDPKETKEIAFRLAKLLKEGSLLILTGDLGAGKTTFTQGLAKGLGIEKNVTSPTFTLMKVYKGDLPLYHIDAYRLEGIDQDLGFEELLEDDGVCVIEWPVFMQDLLPDEYLQIDIKRIEEDDTRELSLIPKGEKYKKVVEEL